MSEALPCVACLVETMVMSFKQKHVDELFAEAICFHARKRAPEFGLDFMELGMSLGCTRERHLYVMAKKCVDHSITEYIIKPWKSLHQNERRNFRQNV